MQRVSLRSDVTRLAAISLALRLALIGMVLWGAWELIALAQPLGAIRWALMVPAILAVTSILFAEILDFEAAMAWRAVRGAVFADDRFGGRAETVRWYAREYVRMHGRRPTRTHVLHNIYTREPFLVEYGGIDADPPPSGLGSGQRVVDASDGLVAPDQLQRGVD
jgi:hypothetical protein